LGANAITVYDLAARGNAPPLRTISGGSTLLDRPQGVAVDVVHDELVVANRPDPATPTNPSIAVYYRHTLGPDNPPKRRIAGDQTGLDFAHGVVVDTVHDEILVANFGSQSAPSIRTFHRTDTGNVAPFRTLSGASTTLNEPVGLALDPVHDE